MMKNSIKEALGFLSSCGQAFLAFLLFLFLEIFAIKSFLENPAFDLPLLLNFSRLLAMLAILVGLFLSLLRLYYLIFVSQHGEPVSFFEWCNNLRQTFFEK